MDIESKLFDNKSLSDIMKDVYGNVEVRRSQVNILIDSLNELVTDVSNATIVVPLIKEYLDIGVRSEEQLVKLIAVVQRLISSESRGGDSDDTGTLSDKEKADLLKLVRDTKELGENLPATNVIPLASDS